MFNIAVNHKSTEPFVIAMGKLIQNFGMLEMQTILYLECLLKEEFLIAFFKKEGISKRIDIIRSAINERVRNDSEKQST